jgi:hypothetical protein
MDAFVALGSETGFKASPIGKVTETKELIVVGPDGTPTQWASGPGYEHHLGKGDHGQ